jgi:DNA-binding response OmpR family regulator
VLIAPDRPKALALLATAHPDLIVMDVNGETLALIDAVRTGEGLAGRVDPDTPLIVLSRDADRLQRIRVLERGGDDVVRKPFAYPELRARIAAVLRRSEIRRGARILRAGPIVIDVRSREVRVFDRPVELSDKEYQLLVTLAAEPTRVFTREELNVEGLSEQLAAERAGQARAALARETTVERLFAQSAVALEDAAGTLLHVAATFIALDGPLPGLFAEQAGALLAVAARFEEAADLTRARQSE